MVKKLSFFFYLILKITDKVFRLLTKRSFLIYFKDFLEKDSYKNISILGKKVRFFVPNQLTEWRVDSFYYKEPETLEWIDSFQKKNNFIFWDIGANIGLYSIYNSLKNKNSNTICFEPSTSNLRILSRNISINNLGNNIKIFPIPLTNKENKFLTMNENEFIEGGALNTFGENFNFEGKKFTSNHKYQLFGTSINYLLKNNLLAEPDYIKIDVDGIEHLILESANKYLSGKKLKSISIEINENFTKQYQEVLKILSQNKFKILHKKNNSKKLNLQSQFSNTFNYIFNKCN
jgi:FkbM family methyltransferase